MILRGFLLLLLMASLGWAQDTTYTIILEGGWIYDGTGRAPYQADIGIIGDRIVRIGQLGEAEAGIRLQVRGLAVTPGFIDIHSHAASEVPQRSGVFRQPLAENYIRQGVTTAFAGQDGSSPLPIASFLSRLDAMPAAVNLGLFVGHGTIRRRVMGNENRAPTPAEMDSMRFWVARSMKEGAWGLSTGLKYVPGAYAQTEEVIELAAVAGRYGGIYITHMRDEGLKVLESVDETIRIGREGHLPVQITHAKIIGKQMWGKSRDMLERVEKARAAGVDVSLDQYPYTASSTGISVLFPRWALEGSQQDVVVRLKDPALRKRIKEGILFNLKEDRGGGDPSRVAIAYCAWDTTLNGKNLAEILRDRGIPVTLDHAAELVMEIQERGGCSGIFHAMSEEDVERIMQYPLTMVCSDGGIPDPEVGKPHPRNYGAFARVLARYVRERKVLTPEEAIYKMTGLPAWRLGLPDRGIIREGAYADNAVLDLQSVHDLATFEKPHQYARGVYHVLVNGQLVLWNGQITGLRPGRALRHTPRVD